VRGGGEREDRGAAVDRGGVRGKGGGAQGGPRR
jgi:hypothetical protein